MPGLVSATFQRFPSNVYLINLIQVRKDVVQKVQKTGAAPGLRWARVVAVRTVLSSLSQIISEAMLCIHTSLVSSGNPRQGSF